MVGLVVWGSVCACGLLWVMRCNRKNYDAHYHRSQELWGSHANMIRQAIRQFKRP